MNRWQFDCSENYRVICGFMAFFYLAMCSANVFSADVQTAAEKTLSPATPNLSNQVDSKLQQPPKIEVPPIEMPKKNGPESVAFSSEKIGYQGNWMKKKTWLIRCNEVYDEIYNLITSIQEVRKTFIEKYDAVDAQLDDFYKRLGADQGKMQEVFTGIENYLEKKKKKVVDALSVKQDKDSTINEREMRSRIEQAEDEIKVLKVDLDQLGLDVKSIDDLDKSISERLKKVDEQIAEVAKDVEKAKAIMDQVWDLIDDRKARASFYEISGIVEKYKSILNYLKEDLLSDFEKVSQIISSQIKKAEDGIKALEDKGIFLRDRAKRVDVEREKKKQEKAALASELAAAQKAKAEKAKKVDIVQPWYSKFYGYLIDKVAAVYNLFSSVYTMAFGSKAVVSVRPRVN